MSEVKTEIKSEVKSQNTKDSNQLEQIKTDIIKADNEDSSALNANQDIKQSETRNDESVKTKDVKNGLQVENVKLEVDASSQLEQVSPLTSPSSPKGSEFSISSIGTFKDEVENIIICVGNEYAYYSYQDLKKNDSYKKCSYNAGSYNESVKRQDDTKFDRHNSRSRRNTDKSNNHNERNRSRDNNHTKYCLDKNRNSYSSSSSRSWDKGRSRYTSNRSKHSRSWDRSRRYKGSRSPPYRSKRRRRRSRSRNRSSSFTSSKLSLPKKGSLTKKKKLPSDSPLHTVGKVLDHIKFPDNWTVNCRMAKSPSPKPPLLPDAIPPLPNSPPPPQPPLPVENYTANPQLPLSVNNVTNAGLSSHLWVNQGNQNFRNFYPFQNSLMPSVSVNNLPLVPGLGNLPVHITATGEQILHDMDGRPVPIGPNGRLLPVDMSGRLYPHIVFPYSNQAVPVYMTEDGVLRLPNGEPVPYGVPSQLPVNIDGTIIPIGPDSRPLFQCPNIPRQNPFISLQVGNPNISVESQQNVQTIPSSAVTKVNTNTCIKKRFNQVQLPPTVIQIETVSDLELKNRRTLTEVIKIEEETDSKKELEKNKSETLAATNETESVVHVPKPPLAETTAKCLDKVSPVINNVPERKLYEDVDLVKLVEKFSERVSKIKIRAIYQKKVRGNVKEKMKPPEMGKGVACSKTNKTSEPLLGCDANPEKKRLCTVQANSEKYPRITSDQNSPNFKKDTELSVLEDFYEKKFTEAIHEAISLFAEIDFKPPVFGRFLFSESSTNFINQSAPNTSPLLRNTIQLPFLSFENFGSQSKRNKSCVNFRFLPHRDGRLSEATIPSLKLSFAVQCDFTSKIIQNLYTKTDRLKRELFRCKNENAELTDLYKSVREECKKKTEELSEVMKKIQEKDKIIRDLRQSRKLWN